MIILKHNFLEPKVFQKQMHKLFGTVVNILSTRVAKFIDVLRLIVRGFRL